MFTEQLRFLRQIFETFDEPSMVGQNPSLTLPPTRKTCTFFLTLCITITTCIITTRITLLNMMELFTRRKTAVTHDVAISYQEVSPRDTNTKDNGILISNRHHKKHARFIKYNEIHPEGLLSHEATPSNITEADGILKPDRRHRKKDTVKYEEIHHDGPSNSTAVSPHKVYTEENRDRTKHVRAIQYAEIHPAGSSNGVNPRKANIEDNVILISSRHRKKHVRAIKYADIYPDGSSHKETLGTSVIRRRDDVFFPS
jgi:hypothetical protein